MPELPMLPTVPRCPAAQPIAGACGSQQGVICRAMQIDVEKDAGIATSPGALARLQHDHENASVYLNLKSDPSTVTRFCHGDALPVLTDDDGQGRASYTYCAVWQAERDRIREGRDSLVIEEEPEPVSMGMEPDPFGNERRVAQDPWAQARADLDLLAGYPQVAG